MQKTGAEKKARRNLRIERANSGRWINLVEDATKTQRGQRTKGVQLGIFRATQSYPIVSYRTLYYVHYAPIAGLKLVISSYSSSFSCSRLISSLCTSPKINTDIANRQINTHSQIQKTPDPVVALLVHHLGHAGREQKTT